MRINKAIFCLLWCLSFALAGLAQTTNVLDWQFNTADNPAEPTLGSTINPDQGDPLATFTATAPGGVNYSFLPRGGYGSPSGTWEIDFGQLQLSMDRSAVGPVSYTLQVYQFIDTFGLYPGNLTLDPATSGVQPVSRVAYASSDIVPGAWYMDTYTWSAVTLNPTISLSMTGTGGSPLLLDEVKLTIVGTLVPEPGFGLISAAGLLAFGLRSWLRRKA